VEDTEYFIGMDSCSKNKMRTQQRGIAQ